MKGDSGKEKHWKQTGPPTPRQTTTYVGRQMDTKGGKVTKNLQVPKNRGTEPYKVILGGASVHKALSPI